MRIRGHPWAAKDYLEPTMGSLRSCVDFSQLDMRNDSSATLHKDLGLVT